ncbi:MAG: hypothetical protein K1060chlam1_00189 [Candidatus Anoxychlamydiales bacterium]|nr:hypothetical protein [Candidatus Anoxychlamydiales bacterium]
MRLLSIVTSFIFIIFIGSWIWFNYPEVRVYTYDFISRRKFNTLEVRYSAENIMEAHRKELLKDGSHSFLEPDLKFHPYLLMEVKYNRTQDKTGEGIILWSLTDGEMVINTSTWDMSHGFKDCIRAGADKDDFKIINTLVSRGGSLDRETLSKILNVDNDTLDQWLENCRRKNLIVQNGNSYRLHFQNPKMQVIPETKIDQSIVSKAGRYAARITKKFRASQIEGLARSAFGNDFAIRKKTEIFLPVYSIVVQNPDGSLMTTYFNALNGKKLSQSHHIE